MNTAEKKRSMNSWKTTTDNILKKGDSGFVTVFDMSGQNCALCKNTSNLRKCKRCFRATYCSKDCQRLDWKNHRSVCLEVTARANLARQKVEGKTGPAEQDEVVQDENAAPSVTAICENCKRTDCSLKKCGRCLETQYCSKECQREDWPQHKQQCKKLAKENVLSIFLPSCSIDKCESKTESDWEAGKMFKDIACAISPGLGIPTRHSSNPALTWAQAQRMVRSLHADKLIITKLKDVTVEEDLDPVKMTSTVFLSRLARPHPYIFRHAWYLEDQEGQEVRIFFYLDNDVCSPYFEWSQLDCGNFLCLEFAYIHTFLDGTTGIRVDDACDVSIIGD